MKTYYPYKGWDWVELCEAFNVPWERIDVTDGVAFNKYLKGDEHYGEWYYLQQYVLAVCGQSHTHWGGKNFVLRRTAFEIREYLKKLKEDDHGYYPPLWEGMVNMKDDWSMLQAFSALCGHAWS